MNRVALLLSVLAATSLSVICVAQEEPTHFRKQHVIVIEAEPGRAVSLELTAIRASLGYPDALAYRIYGPDGASASGGRLEPGGSERIELVAEVAGLYLLDANPGMNAFSLRVEGAPWAVDIHRTRRLNVIDHARPMYFRVPDDPGTLTLGFSGEAASVRLFGPDGELAAARELEQYEQAELTVPVPPGQGGWWRLELDLSEDQGVVFPEGVPPVVAAEPLSDDMLRRITEEPALVDFDMRPTPARQLVAGHRGEAGVTLRTDDGMVLGLDGRGRVSTVALDGDELAGAEGSPLAGFMVRDAAADSALVAFEGAARSIDDGAWVESRAPGLGLELAALYAERGDHLSVNATVTNLREEDRAVTVYFALPFPPGEASWWDDIHTATPASGNATLGAFHRISAGANGHHSMLPFGCVTGDEGLALSIPMDHPVLHRIACSPASRQLFLAVDLALTDATTRFPGRARFFFTISRCDPRWGLRSVAARYYRTFPDLFEKRIPEDGGWVCWGDCSHLPNIAQLGFLYHWGPSGPEAVAFDDSHDLHSFLYNDSARYFADLGQSDERPSGAEAAEAMRRLLDAEDPRAHILSARESATGRARYLSREALMGREAAERWLRDSIAAVRRSAARGPEGGIQVGYLVNRADWGGTDWWTGRVFCNIDPDIEGGYGQFLFERILRPTDERYREEGAELDGFGLDNFFSNATSLDFSREHLAACDFPPTFATGDHRPVVTGAAIVYEWVAELKRRLDAEGRWLIANTGRQPFCFSQHLLDINGLEWGMQTWAPSARVLAYHKPVVTLPVKPEHYEEAFIRVHLPMGAIPGGYASGDRFLPDTEVARLYERYVPILRRMSEAGWEPIPHATADEPAVRIERFGRDLPLLLSLHNPAEEPISARVSVDLQALGLEARSARDLLGERDLAASVAGDALTFTVRLAAGDATAIELR